MQLSAAGGILRWRELTCYRAPGIDREPFLCDAGGNVMSLFLFSIFLHTGPQLAALAGDLRRSLITVAVGRLYGSHLTHGCLFALTVAEQGVWQVLCVII